MTDPGTLHGAETPSTTPHAPVVSATAISNLSNRMRSCIVCAQKKVACDRRDPCSRCVLAGTSCIRPPRARRANPTRRSTADVVQERLQVLEETVQRLNGDLEHARATPKATIATVEAGTNTPQVSSTIARNRNDGRSVSSSSWPRLQQETKYWEEHRASDQTESGRNCDNNEPLVVPVSSHMRADRTPLERHAFFLFNKSTLTRHDTAAPFPMTSQIPFLLETFAERVHSIIGLPHMPSLEKLVQKRHNEHLDRLALDEEALVLSVLYAAVCSLDDAEVITCLNISKDELALNCRTALENGLAKADFLNNPTMNLMQAFVVFLALARRDDSPKYIWMMIGLAVRMARYLGYHHVASDSKHVTPFQREMHRRIWWNLCILDMRATEDQGAELAITPGTYSTSIPSSLNDTDIWPEMEHSPAEHSTPTSVTLLRLCSKITRVTHEVMTEHDWTMTDVREQRLAELAHELDREYFGVTDQTEDPAYLAAAATMRMIFGRLTIQMTSSLQYASGCVDFAQRRTRLMITAMEVLEYNHALNCAAECQPWRWVYQTQRHWRAIVYLLVEICRRSWSPTAERAWMALQSPWSIPKRAPSDENLSIMLPLKRLMERARKHREDEVSRLQMQPDIATRIESEDQAQMPVPSSSIAFPTYFDQKIFHDHWHRLMHSSAASITRPSLGSMCSTGSMNHSPARIDPSLVTLTPSPSARGPETSPTTKNRSSTETPGEKTSYSLSKSWPAASLNHVDWSHLDAFIGIGGEGDACTPKRTDEDELLDFDWNHWFELVKGTP